jgi:hypothetical protein
MIRVPVLLIFPSVKNILFRREERFGSAGLAGYLAETLAPEKGGRPVE